MGEGTERVGRDEQNARILGLTAKPYVPGLAQPPAIDHPGPGLFAEPLRIRTAEQMVEFMQQRLEGSREIAQPLPRQIRRRDG